MGKQKSYKCSFFCCPYDNKEISADEAVKVGKRYMHKDCAKNSLNITKIKDLYYQNISDTVVMSQLVKTIKSIIFSKKIDSDYLLFALSYCIKNNIPISSPYGLHYIIDYPKIKQAWKKVKAEKVTADIKNHEVDVCPNSNSFNYKIETIKTFGDILKGGS